MQNEGYTVNTVITNNIVAVKQKLGIPPQLSSCHTAVVEDTGQIIEGHVPVRAIEKLLAQPDTQGVAAPGMPHNAPGMGELDGNLVTVDLEGRPFSRDQINKGPDTCTTTQTLRHSYCSKYNAGLK